MNTDLATEVITYIDQNKEIGAFSKAVLEALRNGKSEFNIAPDEAIDVKRLPKTVVDLPSLLTYIKDIRSEISAEEPGADKAKSAVATSGKLKVYKLAICTIFALSTYLDDVEWKPQTVKDLCKNVMMHAKENAPAGMSDGGKKMWSAIYDKPEASPRNVMFTRAVIYLCRDKKTGPSDKPEDPGSDDGKSNEVPNTPESTSAPQKEDDEEVDEEPGDSEEEALWKESLVFAESYMSGNLYGVDLSLNHSGFMNDFIGKAKDMTEDDGYFARNRGVMKDVQFVIPSTKKVLNQSEKNFLYKWIEICVGVEEGGELPNEECMWNMMVSDFYNGVMFDKIMFLENGETTRDVEDYTLASVERVQVTDAGGLESGEEGDE
jgi:hypothetical protein